ncbi:RING finger domain-containing protein [Delitschia confertaspora ATCC 74209]|uniref:E3 ubiquitin-protein ligase n=1 Tax=Delitschia confertaspora ATCC 74209 TaxID=1513339 RepID=A0A9P4JSJ0_9PLEO|nr:RING finger domain-containing protein [Delitschia confertaspora ATCC 74209]
MLMSLDERGLCLKLRDFPQQFNYRYTDEARRELLQILFRSLAGRGDYIRLFFPEGPPTDPEKPWSLRDAQGAIAGAEYTEAARGKPCGHIFKSGESTYRCKTCTSDETCVLCARCFDASDHEGHAVYVSVSPGNSGCCDCGDDEAWIRPVHCNIHSATSQTESKAAGKARQGSLLPDDLQSSIQRTIARALDYLIDVFSCSPEQLRLPKTEQSVLEDERTSRLTSKWYGKGDIVSPDQEFALVLWNDEKHTVHDVRDQVARACKQRKQFGLSKAYEVDEVGRSTIVYSTDITELLRMAKIIEDIKLTVTIRSARDTFREEMCATIIEWITDIAGCSVGPDHDILRHTVCEEMLKPWRVGSEASHQHIGQDGIDDCEAEENDLEEMNIITRMMNRHRRQAAANRRRDGNDDATASEDDDDDEAGSAGEDTEDMDIDEFMAQDNDGDVDMDAYESQDEALEVSEATIAGYPPPPPPPPAPTRARGQVLTPAESEADTMFNTSPPADMEPSLQVPETPRSRPLPLRPPRPPKYWLERPESYGKKPDTPAHEDLWQRLRLDFLILYDLRMWKKARINVRDVFISTVVTIPHFKRLLGLRFAGVYTTLAQLYLIADREPDHSIINLSLQMLTTPSITAEVVERGNFLTNLIAILYTFLTTRQVGYPWNVDPKATLAFEQGAVTNRRMYHFFLDMKYLLHSEHVQERLREEDRYLLQFLDLIKLHQGICPNVRAVGEHLEYETDAWISASLITREINKLCRLFSEAFSWSRDEDPTTIRRAIRWAARVAIVNSLGAERYRFDQAEVKHETKFKTLDVFEFDAEPSTFFGRAYKIVDFIVAKEPMSFHHALHYTLSWLIDRGKSMPSDHLLGLLLFSFSELKEPYVPQGAIIPDHQPDEYLLALFDFPIRVCAWLAQMRAGMWVRNGITLRHQMSQYKNVIHRDVSYQRDIFLLQTALVICDPSVFLATMVDRFGLIDWIKGHYENQAGFEDSQVVEVAEDFVHLLIILLTDRTNLIPVEDEADHQVTAMQRDIAHILCFKPLSYSELLGRVSDRIRDAEDEFTEVLEEMTRFRPPEGLSDSGTFELKEEYLDLVDPYCSQYTRNQREEAETVYRNYMAKKTGKPTADIVFEPNLRPIQSGVFKDLSNFTRTSLFTQMIYYLLGYALVAQKVTPNIPITRVEAYVQFVLQLVLVAILEDKSEEHDWAQQAPGSFATSILTKEANVGLPQQPTILSILKSLTEIDAFKSCEPKVNLILHRLKQRQQGTFIIATEALHMAVDRGDTSSPASSTIQEKELKKKQALDRQARVMAAFKEQQGKFMANQDIDWGEEDFSDLEDETSALMEEEKAVKYPSGTCILCQEETNDQRLYGTFGYVSESGILRTTDTQDDDWVDEVTQTPTSLDRSAESIRPFGVASKNKRMMEKVTSTGDTILLERQDLAKGFPCSQTRGGPVTIGCGHIMHYSCFEVYIQATQRRHVSQIARNHPERPERKEFMCPLCKALGNMFLPIIWKGKTVTYPGVLDPQTSFGDYIESEVAINISKFDKSPERADGEPPANLSRQQKTLFEYADRAFISPVASQLPTIAKSNFMVTVAGPARAPPPPTPVQRIMERMLPALLPDDPQDPLMVSSESNPTVVQSFPMLELVRVYQRLRDTFRVNGIPSIFGSPHTPAAIVEDLTHTDTLARTLGFSIAAVEIAQRGVQSESMRGTLLDKISPQTLTHLRVYSETVNSYIAVGCLRNQGSTKTMQEYLDLQCRQLHQLFIGHPNIFDPDNLPYDLKAIPPLLDQDPFTFLTECSAGVVPALNLNIYHILRLCYLAEIVRVVRAFVTDDWMDTVGNPQGEDIPIIKRRNKDFTRFISPSKASSDVVSLDLEQTGSLHRFLVRLVNVINLHRQPNHYEDRPEAYDLGNGNDDNDFVQFMYTMISTYALPFLRKAAILMHVRYGVEFPLVPPERVEEPELDRLSSLLKLPSLHEIFESFVGDNWHIRSVADGWIRHHFWSHEGKRPVRSTISLSHPAIFELVGLPKNYDTLTDEAIRRRCPTTGKELTDPCVCLFCGEILCSQGVCCMKDKNKGGCFQHQEKCGGNIGLFINIRKCMVLFLNGTNGTWAVAPYLDKHGEVDPTLRRHYQLFLNQKRYDILQRQVWLNHGIPSLIARRLEGDVNNGGWETL